MVRMPRFHRGDRGSIPRMGSNKFFYSLFGVMVSAPGFESNQGQAGRGIKLRNRTRCGDIKGSHKQYVQNTGSKVTIIFPYSNSSFLTQNQPHYASRVRIPPWTCIVQVSKRSKEVTTKKEKETRLFSRAVKGVTLKMSCFGFVGSNPTAATYKKEY